MKKQFTLICLACSLAAAMPLAAQENSAADARSWSITGAVGFPHFGSAQILRKIGEKWAIGAGAGMSLIPENTQPCGAKVKMNLRSIEATAHYYPSAKSFFIGSHLGYQKLVINSVQNAYPDYNIDEGLKLVYLTPHVGWLKVYDSGFSLGFEIGVQVPLSKSRYTNHTGPGAMTDDVQKKVNDGLDLLGSKPMPYLTLLRIGYSF